MCSVVCLIVAVLFVQANTFRMVERLENEISQVDETENEDEENPSELFNQLWKEMDDHVTDKISELKQYLNSKIARLSRRKNTPVVTTSPIGFHAMKSDEETYKRGGTIIFEDVIFNQGNGYNPNTGRFIAPKSGMYVFTSTIRVERRKATAASIVVNGKMVGELFADSRGARRRMNDSGSTTVVVQLKTGDRVCVHNANHWSGFVDANFSSFSGFRVG